MANFDVFLDKLQSRYGLEFFGVFYGVYRAKVTRNDDPEERGRIQIQCARVGHRAGIGFWVDSAEAQAGNDHGNFFPPEVGSFVKVVFDNGNPAKPHTYWGGWFTIDGRPSEFRYTNGRPERRGIITRAGHRLIFTDEAGQESIRIIWHKPDENDASLTDVTKAADRTTGRFSIIGFEPDGSIQIADPDGSRVDINNTNNNVMLTHRDGHTLTLDADGIKAIDKAGNYLAIVEGQVTLLAKDIVHVVAPKVSIKAGAVFLGDGASEKVVLGDSFLAFFNTHTHPTGTGPSGSPINPMTPALLSQTVKTRK